MKAFVTGGAGFVGSNLCERLLEKGAAVTAYDDLSLGRREFLKPFMKLRRFRFIERDILKDRGLARSMAGHDIVFHMQANSDIGKGLKSTDRDLKMGTIATYRVLDAMRVSRVKKIVFASTSAVYGESQKMPTPESYGPLLPISLYGASKLASEAQIAAYSHLFGIRAWIYRFGNVAGRNGTHGIMVDLIGQIKKRPRFIRVLGDGRQAKPYIHVDDCVDGMLFGLTKARGDIVCLNLTPRGATSVRSIVDRLVREMGVAHLPIRYAGGPRGWPGDVPQVRLDGSLMAKLGWKPKLSSDAAVALAVSELVEQMKGP